MLYVLRALVGRAIPLNSGCLRDVSVHIPERSILNPSPGRAVAGGNVETSQRVVDVLLGALGRAAASQGTMNNVSFGQQGFGYYETIAGGAGAGPGFSGRERGAHAHDQHAHHRPGSHRAAFPGADPRIFTCGAVRAAAGSIRGGDGVCREYEFLEPLTVSLLSERRLSAPFGLAGGQAGRARPKLPQRPGSARPRGVRGRSRRPPADRDAGRRRLRRRPEPGYSRASASLAAKASAQLLVWRC